MDATAFIWKILLTKISIKTLTLSLSFDCFLRGSSRLYGTPARRVVCPTALGLRRTAQRGPCPKYSCSSVPGRISKPDSSSQTASSSPNLPWMEWLYRLEFQLPPSSQRLFFPSLTQFLKVSHLRPSLLKIAPERAKHLKLLEKSENIL